jgi:hypothetical protein
VQGDSSTQQGSNLFGGNQQPSKNYILCLILSK